jgi:phosphatidylserine/phosphatidylglycerophosphate/cardiolipin synthase-like enzyme
MQRFTVRIVVLLSLLLALTVACSNSQHTDISSAIQTPKVYFSPHGGATDAIVKEIDKAKSEVLVQAYSFTSKEIAKALVDAHKRGVHTEIILDKSNLSAQYSAADFTAHMGIPTYIDAEHAIAHNKVIIIDGETVVTGSFNFTKAAEERNAENLLIVNSKELAKEYIDNWNKHKSHSQEYKGR